MIEDLLALGGSIHHSERLQPIKAHTLAPPLAQPDYTQPPPQHEHKVLARHHACLLSGVSQAETNRLGMVISIPRGTKPPHFCSFWLNE